jgi:hypothetical protein
MSIHTTLGKHVSVAAAATLALGLATAGTAHADPPQRSSASLADDILTIVATNRADAIRVALAPGDPTTLLVDFGNGAPLQPFPRTTFSAIEVFLGAGNDHFAAGAGFADKALTVIGGVGNDTIVGGDGDDVLAGSQGEDIIHGGNGVDAIFGQGGDDIVDGDRGNDLVVLGTGDDTALWLPGEASDVVDGGAGEDALAFTGANVDELASLAASGHRVLFSREPGAVRMDLDGVELLDLTTLRGADAVTVNDLTGTDLRQLNIDLGSQGAVDGQSDAVTVNGTAGADEIDVGTSAGAVAVTGLRPELRVSNSEPADRLQVDTLGGDDQVRVGQDATALIGVLVDLGIGQ